MKTLREERLKGVGNFDTLIALFFIRQVADVPGASRAAFCQGGAAQSRGAALFVAAPPPVAMHMSGAVTLPHP